MSEQNLALVRRIYDAWDRDGQAVRFRWFSSHAEALAAAGLSKSA